MRGFFSISISKILLVAGVSFAGKPVAFQLHFLSGTGQKSFGKLVSAKIFIENGHYDRLFKLEKEESSLWKSSEATRSEACPCSEAVPADDLWNAIAHCEAALASGEDCKPDSIYLILGKLKARLELKYSTIHDIRYDEYAKNNPQEFWHSEIGGDYFYNGFHFKELIKRFPQSDLVDDAAYELTTLSVGGECEGSMDCYIERQFNQVKKFLEEYRDSEHAEEAVKRANEAFLRNLDSPIWVQNFGAIKDYTVAQENYEPQAIQQTLAVYETIASLLPLQLRAKASETIAGLWERFKQLDRAIRLYSFIIQEAPECENITAIKKRLSSLLPEAPKIRFINFYEYLVKLHAEFLQDCGSEDVLTIMEIEFADLDHDGQEEAVVEAMTCAMGTGGADITEVFKLLDSGELTALKINDESYSENLYEGHNRTPRLNVQNGRLIRWFIMFDKDRDNVHPKVGWKRIITYKWQGNEFVIETVEDFAPEED